VDRDHSVPQNQDQGLKPRHHLVQGVYGDRDRQASKKAQLQGIYEDRGEKNHQHQTQDRHINQPQSAWNHEIRKDPGSSKSRVNALTGATDANGDADVWLTSSQRVCLHEEQDK
jgi:hypothetical protein